MANLSCTSAKALRPLSDAPSFDLLISTFRLILTLAPSNPLADTLPWMIAIVCDLSARVSAYVLVSKLVLMFADEAHPPRLEKEERLALSLISVAPASVCG